VDQVGPKRTEYTRGELRREDLRADPFEQFAAWFDQACGSGIAQPDAMSLATVSAAGQPSLRTVLLKRFDHQGFVFFTNLESRKAREIAGNPRVALLFSWQALERQVSITGAARGLSTAEVLKYFLTRPRGSRISAWCSPQSRVIESRKLLEMEWQRMSQKFAQGEIPLPSFWGGFCVVPDEIEFWQGRENRLHDRFLYGRGVGGWVIRQLAP
jgi:pyridoxamine 5'-phosphate oxidase